MIFHCARCGSCCRWEGYVRLKEEQIARIAAILGMPVLEFTGQYCRLTADRGGLSLIERENGSCIFLEENPAGCRIEPVKPRQCREFPLRWNFPGWREVCAGSLEEENEEPLRDGKRLAD